MNVIETERLTKSYGSHRGIIEVDLVVQEGEVFGSWGRTAPARPPRSGRSST